MAKGGTGKGGTGPPSAKQKAARARMKALWTGRGKGSSPATSRPSRSTSPKSSSGSAGGSRKGPTLAMTYRGLTTGALLAGPAIVVAETYQEDADRGARELGRDTVTEVWDQYKEEAAPLTMGVVTHALSDVLGQKLVQHNTALGRGSITAWVAEAIPVGRAALVAKQEGGVAGTKQLVAGKTGYKPGVGYDLDNAKDHLVAKAVAGLIRKAANTSIFRPIATPLKQGLSAMGAHL